MEGDFFNKLGLADMEKVHSAVIGWMLSDDCQAFDISTRSKILNELFNSKHTTIYKNIKSFIEWKNIDILFLTENNNGSKECWVIENKIKSTQHNNQLNKYEAILNDSKESDNFSSYKKHYIFLSFISEDAKSDNDVWINRTYDDLSIIIKDNLKCNPDNTDSIILKEYSDSISNLVNEKNSFLSDHLNPKFSVVFKDGSKKKYDKESTGIISNNQLEATFQKAFYKSIFDKVLNKSPELKDIILSHHINEIHGNANISLLVEEYEFEPSKSVYFDLAFQNGTFKIVITINYNSNSIRKINKSIRLLKNEWGNIFKEAKNIYNWRCQYPRSRPRISLTHNIPNWYNRSIDDIVDLWIKELKTALSIKEYIISTYKKYHQ